MPDQLRTGGSDWRPVAWAARRTSLARWIVCVCLPVALAGTTLKGRVAGAETVYRSLRAEGHNRLDERKLPSHTLRVCHLGWEARSKHFVVVSTIAPEQAIWTSRQLEGVWAEIGQLADHWTNVHRQPDFGIGAVGVIVTDRLVHPRALPAPGPAKTNFSADIFINLPGRGQTLQKQLPRLRREAFLAFLRVAQQDQVLPDWVQVGMADYFSGEAPPEVSARSLAPPEPITGPPTGVWSRRLAADRMAPLQRDRLVSTLWVRYLLLGNDARHAPQLFAAMTATIGDHARDPFHPGPGVGAVVRFASAPPRQDSIPLAGLISRVSPRAELREWLADPESGQPIPRPVPENTPLEPSLREMVLILKLASRFSRPPTETIRPRIGTAENGTGKDFSETPEPRPIDLSALYRRLTDSDRGPWATIDIDGSLLLSSNSERVDAIFADCDRCYRTTVRNGRDVLERRRPDGQLVEAWLEENPDDPHRPLARIQPPGYEPPKPEVTAAEPSRRVSTDEIPGP